MKKLLVIGGLFLFIINGISNGSFAEMSFNNVQVIGSSLETVEDSIRTMTVSNPQDYGYKDFKWGMSLKDVQSMLPIDGGVLQRGNELAKTVNGATAFLFPRYKEQLQIGDNGEALSAGPFVFESGDSKMGVSLGKVRGDKLADCYYNFYFVDNKLVGVTIGFRYTQYRKVLSDLIRKYGKVAAPVILPYKSNYKDYDVSFVAWVAKGEIVVLNNEFGLPLPSVTYIDINWYNKCLVPFLAESVGNEVKNEKLREIERKPIE